MKTTVDIYSCDFCGFVIDNFENDYTHRFDGAWIHNSADYQTSMTKNGHELLFCKSCCDILKNAIKRGFVHILTEVDDKMKYDAGYRKDGDKWIPVSLYLLKLEKGLIND